MKKAYLIEQVNPKHAAYLRERRQAGKSMFAFRGGRRSGKTFFILQFLITELYNHGRIVNVASMTAEQGRLGAYADACTIVKDCPTLYSYLECLQSPREIRNLGRGGKMVFNSYTNSETAKGIACDWLFVNEANNFTKQQVVDLMANVRLGVIFDYNPNIEFWISDFFAEDEICNSTWQDNKQFLTPTQLEYFAQLKRDAEKPDATSIDIRNYMVYYLGKYSEISGNIFNAANIRKTDTMPEGLRNFIIFCDPSALRGADYFACVLSATDRNGDVYIIDTYSPNVGTNAEVTRHLLDWCGSWDVEACYIETNGIIGVNFFEFATNSGLPIVAWNSHRNKYERICANYQDITSHCIFLNNGNNAAFLEQVYTFSEKCEHDDNIDAISSTISAHKTLQ